MLPDLLSYHRTVYVGCPRSDRARKTRPQNFLNSDYLLIASDCNCTCYLFSNDSEADFIGSKDVSSIGLEADDGEVIGSYDDNRGG